MLVPSLVWLCQARVIAALLSQLRISEAVPINNGEKRNPFRLNGNVDAPLMTKHFWRGKKLFKTRKEKSGMKSRKTCKITSPLGRALEIDVCLSKSKKSQEANEHAALDLQYQFRNSFELRGISQDEIKPNHFAIKNITPEAIVADCIHLNSKMETDGQIIHSLELQSANPMHPKAVRRLLNLVYNRAVEGDIKLLKKGKGDRTFGEFTASQLKRIGDYLEGAMIGGLAGKRVIDLGSGVGNVCGYFSAIFKANTAGIEISERAARMAARFERFFKQVTDGYGLPRGDIDLREGNFLDEHMQNGFLAGGQVYICNNYVMEPTTQEALIDFARRRPHGTIFVVSKRLSKIRLVRSDKSQEKDNVRRIHGPDAFLEEVNIGLTRNPATWGHRCKGMVCYAYVVNKIKAEAYWNAYLKPVEPEEKQNSGPMPAAHAEFAGLRPLFTFKLPLPLVHSCSWITVPPPAQDAVEEEESEEKKDQEEEDPKKEELYDISRYLNKTTAGSVKHAVVVPTVPDGHFSRSDTSVQKQNEAVLLSNLSTLREEIELEELDFQVTKRIHSDKYAIRQSSRHSKAVFCKEIENTKSAGEKSNDSINARNPLAIPDYCESHIDQTSDVSSDAHDTTLVASDTTMDVDDFDATFDDNEPSTSFHQEENNGASISKLILSSNNASDASPDAKVATSTTKKPAKRGNSTSNHKKAVAQKSKKVVPRTGTRPSSSSQPSRQTPPFSMKLRSMSKKIATRSQTRRSPRVNATSLPTERTAMRLRSMTKMTSSVSTVVPVPSVIQSPQSTRSLSKLLNSTKIQELLLNPLRHESAKGNTVCRRIKAVFKQMRTRDKEVNAHARETLHRLIPVMSEFREVESKFMCSNEEINKKWPSVRDYDGGLYGLWGDLRDSQWYSRINLMRHEKFMKKRREETRSAQVSRSSRR